MGDLRREYESQVGILHPRMKEAEEADRIFHRDWKEGTAELGVQKYKQTARYRTTSSRFQEVTRELEGKVEPAIRGITARETGALAFLLAYLGFPGRFHRSGYAKARIARALKKVDLSGDGKPLLQEILIGSFSWAGGEFRELRKLIPGLLDPEFSARIRQLSRSEDSKVRRRAGQAAGLYLTP